MNKKNPLLVDTAFERWAKGILLLNFSIPSRCNSFLTHPHHFSFSQDYSGIFN